MLFCSQDIFLEFLASLIYMGIALRCIIHIALKESIGNGQANNGLGWYLFLTLFLCLFRSMYFILIPIFSIGCTSTLGKWQEIFFTDENKITRTLSIFMFTAPSALFFSSYTSFTLSLTKVLDMLTDIECLQSSTLNIFLLGLNVALWVSQLLLWIGTFFEFKSVHALNVIADYILISAAIATCFIFSFYCFRSLSFIYCSRGDDRVEQVLRLLKLKRVITVCFICTFIFAFRSVILLNGISFSRINYVFYLLIFEICPTLCMLISFRPRNISSSSSTTRAAISQSSPSLTLSAHEYELLKSRLSQTIGYASPLALLSPNRPWFEYDHVLGDDPAGMIARYYEEDEEEIINSESSVLLPRM